MKKMLVVLALVLGGCASRPTQSEMDWADYGPNPPNYEQIITDYLLARLKDPDSAKIEFVNVPKPGWDNVGGSKFGYVVCVRVNAKNSYGGYTGAQTNYFMLKRGEVIGYSSGGSLSDRLCRGA